MNTVGGEESDQRRVMQRTTTVETSIDRERGVFMISVAAELAEMHPQTLRMYEARGLIQPKRSAKNTRLYSHEDVERLRQIQEMTATRGLNLAGVETVLELESRLDEMRAELAAMQERATQMEQRIADEVELVRRSLGAELVPYGAYETKGIAPPGSDQADRPATVRIPVEGRQPRSSK